MPEYDPARGSEAERNPVEFPRPLGALALLSEIQANAVLAGEQVRAYPMNDNARTLLGRIAGLELLPVGKEITQSTAETIFERVVYPGVRGGPPAFTERL